MKNMIFLMAFTVLFLSCSSAPSGGETTGGGGGGTPSSWPAGIYVSTAGSDASAGTDKTAPVLTIQIAIMKAVSNGLANVYVAEGLYTNGFGLLSFTNGDDTTNSGVYISNHNLALYGGCDTNTFDPQAGRYSILSRGGDPDHVVEMRNATNVTLANFVLTGGYAQTPDPAGMLLGGGLFLSNAHSCLVTNCFLTNNRSWYGAGMGLMHSRNNRIHATLAGNQNCGYGGGIALEAGANENDIRVIITGHVVINMGGGIWIENASSNTISGLFAMNSSMGNGGGGIALNAGSYNVFTNCVIVSNSTLGNYGGGIVISDQWNILIDSFISNNSSRLSGGGAVLSGAYCAVSNTVFAGNWVSNGSVDTFGGGLYLEALNGVAFHCHFVNNRAISTGLTSFGGGIYATQNDGIRVMNSFFSNNSAQYGGALANSPPAGANFTTVESNVFVSNYADEFGGAIYSQTGGIRILQNLVSGNNTGSVASGVFLYGWALIQSNVIASNGGNSYASALWVEGCAATNLQNYFLGDLSVIGLRNANGTVFSSNIIGGAGAANTGYGFNESIYENTTGHILTYNLFLTNRLGPLYYDFNGIHVVTNSATAWNTINDTTYSGAATAAFNGVTNI